MYETIERAKNTDGNAVLAQMFVYASTDISEHSGIPSHRRSHMKQYREQRIQMVMLF